MSVPLGFVIYYAYRLTGNYALAIVIFAFVARTLVFPVNILAHKNSIRLLNLQPSLSLIKKRYGNDKEQLHEEQYNLFKKEKYSPYVGLVPLFIQLFLIIGIFGVMRAPEQHIPYLDPGIWGTIPSFTNPSPALLIPVFVVLSALLFCMMQSAISPGALSQSKGTNFGLTIFTVALMLYFSLVAPFGLGLYLIAWNLFSVAAVLLLNILYNPKKLADEALAYINANRKTPEQIREERLEKKALRTREKQDIARFRATKKQLVFYAISGGQYKYYKNVIEYILEQSDVVIHYITNDPDDALFKNAPERLFPYYIGQRKTIGIMLKLDADIMVTTVPDLQSFHIKRSIVRDDIEYIYIFHGIGIGLETVKSEAFDHFDTVLCTGSDIAAMLRRREKVAQLPRKNLVKAGYGVYDQLVESYSSISHISNEKPQILIAPSWQEDCILDLCIESMLDALIGKGYNIIVRPHPQYIRMFPERIDLLKERYAPYADNDEVTFGLDFSDNKSIFLSDILITDWSGIAFEFSFSTLKPCIFINTPMKILNHDYMQYEAEETPYSVILRNKVGVSVDLDDIKTLDETVNHLLTNKNSYKEIIEQTLNQTLYHPGRSGEAGGKYIIGKLKDRKAL